MPNSKRKTVFVRHGEYDPDSTKIELTPRGHEQARQAGKHLVELGFEGAPIIASFLTRTAQTAHDIARETGSADPILSEDIYKASQMPAKVANLDALLDKVTAENGIAADAPLIIVSHAEILSKLPGNYKRIAEVAFCETVEYEPHTWRQPL